MFKVEAFSKLNIITRRYYLVYLNKKNKDKFVQDIFSKFHFTDFLYIKVKKNIVKNLKQEKTNTLKTVNKFVRV